jgi:hypothetical protein
VDAENGADIRTYREDHGSGQPGGAYPRLPFNAHSWERQERVLLQLGTGSSPTTGADSASPASDRYRRRLRH